MSHLFSKLFIWLQLFLFFSIQIFGVSLRQQDVGKATPAWHYVAASGDIEIERFSLQQACGNAPCSSSTLSCCYNATNPCCLLEPGIGSCCPDGCYSGSGDTCCGTYACLFGYKCCNTNECCYDPSLTPKPTATPTLSPTRSSAPTSFVPSQWTCAAASSPLTDNIANACANPSNPCLPGLTSIMGLGYDITLGVGSFPYKQRVIGFSSASNTMSIHGTEYSAPPSAELQVNSVDISSQQSSLLSSYFDTVTSYTTSLGATLGIESSTQAVPPITTSTSSMSSILMRSTGVSASYTTSVSHGVAKNQYSFNYYAAVAKAQYSVIADPYGYGQLCSSYFQTQLSNLPTAYVSGTYLSFIGNFGTHVVVSAEIGGIISQDVEQSSCTFTSSYTVDQGLNAFNTQMGSFTIGQSSATTTVFGSTVQRSSASVCGGNSQTYFTSTSTTPWDAWAATVFGPDTGSCGLGFTLVPIYAFAPSNRIQANLETAMLEYVNNAAINAGLSTATASCPTSTSSAPAFEINRSLYGVFWAVLLTVMLLSII